MGVDWPLARASMFSVRLVTSIADSEVGRRLANLLLATAVEATVWL
jgi:hypothetical protein